jgi:hypothetical protein
MNVGLIYFDCPAWRSSNGLESIGMMKAEACTREVRIRKGVEEGNRCSIP